MASASYDYQISADVSQAARVYQHLLQMEAMKQDCYLADCRKINLSKLNVHPFIGEAYRAEEYHQQYLAKGGRFGCKQSAEKGCNDPIRCYG
ncbi:hypothetical protein GOBAR_DD29889 [Gossypium barbadense]|nr:hypothetical protein GOBAR_DD29889 [Gossypium barbadense]